MTEISELDLQNLRHLIGGFDTTHCKMQDYEEKEQDMEVKQFLQKNSHSDHQTKQKLMQFLH